MEQLKGRQVQRVWTDTTESEPSSSGQTAPQDVFLLIVNTEKFDWGGYVSSQYLWPTLTALTGFLWNWLISIQFSSYNIFSGTKICLKWFIILFTAAIFRSNVSELCWWMSDFYSFLFFFFFNSMFSLVRALRVIAARCGTDVPFVS